MARTDDLGFHRQPCAAPAGSGTGYFDDVTTVIQGGASPVTALTGSTDEEQFR